MAVREVLRYPHPALKQEATPLAPGDSDLIATVARDLVDTMESFGHCVGLAAPQLEHAVRMLVVDVSTHPKATAHNGRLVLVNPRVVAAEGAEVGREGCLSIPHLTANVRRAARIRVDALAPGGGAVSLASEGFEARCIQHEVDHLDGLLFLDRVESLTADVFRRKRYAS